MSTNEVTLFGVLAADAEIRKTAAGVSWALLKVDTFHFVRDPGTKKPVAQATTHEVHCFDELSIEPLASLGKKGYWIRIRGQLTYTETRQAFVLVPLRGGLATVSAYFGSAIRPDMPFQTLMAQSHPSGADQFAIDALHAQAAGETSSSAQPVQRPPAASANAGSTGGVAGSPARATAGAPVRPPGPRPVAQPVRQQAQVPVDDDVPF